MRSGFTHYEEQQEREKQVLVQLDIALMGIVSFALLCLSLLFFFYIFRGITPLFQMMINPSFLIDSISSPPDFNGVDERFRPAVTAITLATIFFCFFSVLYNAFAYKIFYVLVNEKGIEHKMSIFPFRNGFIPFTEIIDLHISGISTINIEYEKESGSDVYIMRKFKGLHLTGEDIEDIVDLYEKCPDRL